MSASAHKPEKSAYHHGNLKPTLIAIACALVEEEGQERLTLRAVAERAAVSQTAIYRHFQNKDALLGAVVIDGMHSLRDQTAPELERDVSPLERFYHVGRQYVRFASDHPRLYALMFDKDVHARGCAAVAEASMQAFAVLLRVIGQCQREGAIRADNIDRQAFAVWASVHGLVTLCRDQAPTVAPEATVEHGYEMIWETVIHGLIQPGFNPSGA